LRTDRRSTEVTTRSRLVKVATRAQATHGSRIASSIGQKRLPSGV
jgi:hypothetical protein